jgi:hypothetical protein
MKQDRNAWRAYICSDIGKGGNGWIYQGIVQAWNKRVWARVRWRFGFVCLRWNLLRFGESGRHLRGCTWDVSMLIPNLFALISFHIMPQVVLL